MLNTIIDEKLKQLGVTKNYKGYNQLKEVLILATEDDTRLFSAVKNIFKPLAESHGCTYHSFVKNISTISRKIWAENNEKLCEMAKYELQNEPTVCELIAILVADIQREFCYTCANCKAE